MSTFLRGEITKVVDEVTTASNERREKSTWSRSYMAWEREAGRKEGEEGTGGTVKF